MYKKKNKGMGLVEIIIGSAIISVGILAIINSYNIYIGYALSNKKNVQASYLLEEGLEVVTFMRDKSWSANISPLSPGVEYYLNFNGTIWATTTTPEYVDGQFFRSFNLSNVNRDSGDLISDSGTNDPNTKLLTVTVSYWQGHSTSTKSIGTYITNLNND